MVILVHTTEVGFGRFGVQLFFVISGYLLGDFYLKQSKKQFLVHRALRLFPLAIFFIFMFYVKNMKHLYEVVLNLTLSQNLFWETYSFPGGWSISTEWIFSIFLIYFLPKYKNLLIHLFIFCCILQILSGGFVLFKNGGISNKSVSRDIFYTWLNTINPFINLGFFISGILILMHKNKIYKVNNFILVTFPVIMILFDIKIGHFMFGWQIAIPALFLLTLKASTKSKKFSEFISFIGKRTYGIFFCHFLVIRFLDHLLNIQQYNFLTQSIYGRILNFFVVYFIALIGGMITYKLIEKPFLKMSKRINIS
jgi:peptidoglycan/LPS O-acetylase OafA/YrhL